MARLSLFVLLASTATLALAQAPPPSSTLQPVLTPSPSAAVPPATGSPQVPPPVASQTPGAGPPGSPSLPAPAPGQQAPVVPGAPGAAPGGHGPPGGKESHSPFMYQPSFSIAVGAAIIFIISTTITTVQLFSYKTWYFALILQAAVVDVVASVARCHAVLNPKSMGAYIIQMMGYQIAPSMLGISIFFTFTRVIWWVTPNDKRSRRVLWFPIHKISFCWTLLFALPDIGKGIAGNIGKPAEGKMPNPASIGSRIQQICLAVGFFVAALWTLWAIRFMRMSRKWIINGEAEDKDWRKLGWACVGSGVLLTVSCSCCAVFLQKFLTFLAVAASIWRRRIRCPV